MQNLLDTLYDKALDGVPKVSKSVDELAEDYRRKHHTKQGAARSLANNQIVKCGTSGFITGLGGAHHPAGCHTRQREQRHVRPDAHGRGNREARRL